MSYSHIIRIYQKRYLKYDLTAGVVVFLVAIPLCLGIALASGAPLFSGIIAGIIGGIVVGAISQSSVSVSGPAAGLVAVVLTSISQLGGFDVFLLAVVFAGILQIIIGCVKAGFIADYIPSNVIQGLLCAIGILIIIKQLPLAFTHSPQNEILMDTLRGTSETFSLQPLLQLVGHINPGATLISAIAFLVLVYWDKTKVHYLKMIPGPVVVVIFGVIMNELYINFWPNITQTSAQLVNIPVNHDFVGFLGQFQTPDWSKVLNPNVYLYGFIIAAVASLETLLNLEAAEKLDSRRRYCSRNRELVAQGIGNTFSGLIGGLPITSVVVRSSVNIETGAKTKLSTIIHGVLILIVVMLLPDWLNKIPLASLAAILIFVGYKLSKIAIYKELYNQGMVRFVPFIITVVAIVFTNLLLGILIGLFASFFFILRANSSIRFDIINEKHPTGTIKRIILPQHISFLSKAALVAELESINPHENIIIDARHSKYIDRDILELLKEFKNRQAPDKQISLNLIGLKQRYDIHDHIDFINVTTHDIQASLTAEQVIAILKEGNKRFLADQRIHRSLPEDIKATADMQHPMAVVLGCIDSRVPVETIFDMGVGDVFVIRVAGNVVNEDIYASMEFACHIAGAKLILVLGHTNCGAIRAACDSYGNSHLSALLAKIKPSIQAENRTKEKRDSQNEQYVFNVTKLNIRNSLKNIYQYSVVLNKLIRNKEIGLVGAIYDVKTGEVTFDEALYLGE